MHQEYGEGSLLVHNIVHSCKLAWGIYLLLLLLLVLQMQTIDTLDSNKPKLHCVHMMTLYHLQYYDSFFLTKSIDAIGNRLFYFAIQKFYSTLPQVLVRTLVFLQKKLLSSILLYRPIQKKMAILLFDCHFPHEIM